MCACVWACACVCVGVLGLKKSSVCKSKSLHFILLNDVINQPYIKKMKRKKMCFILCCCVL